DDRRPFPFPRDPRRFASPAYAGDRASAAITRRKRHAAGWRSVRFSGAVLLGAATVFGFAPFGVPALPIVTVALLFAMWHDADDALDAAWLGFGFGLGLPEVGASWLYIALHHFGGMPAPLALIGTAVFCAYLALYPALAGWLATRWTKH